MPVLQPRLLRLLRPHGIAEHRIDCDYEQSGYLLVGTSAAQVKRVEHDFKIMEKWGLDGVERWDRKRLVAEFNTDFYKLGWFEPRCGILNPAKLARGLKGVAESEGVVIYEQSQVTGFLIYRSKQSSAEADCPNCPIYFLKIGDVLIRDAVLGANVPSVVFAQTIEPGYRYIFKVKAYDERGIGSRDSNFIEFMF